MKNRFFLIVICSFFPALMFAQNPAKHHEVGIAFTGFNGFGLSFKYGNERSQCRIKSIIFRSAYDQNSKISYDKSFNVSTSAGHEWLKPVNSNFRLRLGFDVFFNYGYTIAHTDKVSEFSNVNLKKETQSYSPGVSFVVGMDYIIKEHLVLSAELTPSASLIFEKQVSEDYWAAFHANATTTDLSKTVQGSASTSNMQLGIAYRF